MAIYHLNSKIVTKSKGQSACQRAAYVAGEKITSYALGETFNYTKKNEVVYSNILLPKNAPEEYKNREKLWNSVEEKESGANAQLARSLIMALPNELTLDEKKELVENYVQKNFVDRGMCADYSIHDKGDGNPHAHVLLTLREINEQGKWMAKQTTAYKLDGQGERIPVIDKKTKQQKLGLRNAKQWVKKNTAANDWNTKDALINWRASWAENVNAYLPKDKHVDHRTLEAQGIDREPTVHIGYKGGTKNVDKLSKNAEIEQVNENKADIREINKDIEETRKEKVNQRVQITMQKIAIETGLGAEENGDDRGINSGTGRRKRLFPELGAGVTENEDREQEFEIDDIRIEADRSRNFIEQQRVADANREIEEQRAADEAKRKHEKRVRQADYFAPEPAKQAEKDDYQCE